MSGRKAGKRSALRARVERVSDLAKPTIDEMWALFSRFYDDINYERFLRDLSAKNYVLICRDKQQKVQGFSTIHLYYREIQGKKIKVIFSGDTVMSPEYWGYRGMHGAFAKFTVREWLREPLTPFYWFLISKGYKTYLALARNFVNFWPRHDLATPKTEKELIATLASDRFGDAWKSETGLLQFSTPQGRLRDGVVPITTEDLQDPDIAYFVRSNPGHANGDELCCLASFDMDLWMKYIRKTLSKKISRLWRVAPQVDVQQGES